MSGVSQPAKVLEARLARDVAEKDVLILRQEVDIPIELNSEAGMCLVGRRGAMGEEHRKIDLPRQLAEKRRVILNRMRGDDGEAHVGSCGGVQPDRSAARRSKMLPNRRATALAW